MKGVSYFSYMEDVLIAYKKPFYPVTPELRNYLEENNRLTKIQISYNDLLRFKDHIPILDAQGNDTLWLNVFYDPGDHAELELNLKKIYTLLHSDGDDASLPHLTIDSIQF